MLPDHDESHDGTGPVLAWDDFKLGIVPDHVGFLQALHSRLNWGDPMKTFQEAEVEKDTPEKVRLPDNRIGLLKVGATYHVFEPGDEAIMADMLREPAEIIKAREAKEAAQKADAQKLAAMREKLEIDEPLTSSETNWLLKLLLQRLPL